MKATRLFSLYNFFRLLPQAAREEVPLWKQEVLSAQTVMQRAGLSCDRRTDAAAVVRVDAV